MSTQRRAAIRVLLTLAGVAAVAALAVVLFGGGSQTRTNASTATRQDQSSVAASSTPAPRRSRRGRTPNVAPRGTLDQMLGQMIVARFAGSQPSQVFLRRIRRGQIGGVILFADNLTGDPAATRSLTRELQSAARQGGNPPLLIMTDQEGGTVRRVAGPPFLAASQMSTTATARQQGRATGSALRSLGINVDLAPVADVETNPRSFLTTRAFGSTPALVAGRSCGFAAGLATAGVGYTLKHFPGLGMATTSTDEGPVAIDAPAAELRADYAAYRRCAVNPKAMVMVSSAAYPSLTGPLPAVMSPLTYRRELPIAAARTRVPTISDDLQAPALSNETAPARAAINAGLDLAMYAGTEQASAQAYEILKQDVAAGEISPERLRQAAQAILALKKAVAGA